MFLIFSFFLLLLSFLLGFRLFWRHELKRLDGQRTKMGMEGGEVGRESERASTGARIIPSDRPRPQLLIPHPQSPISRSRLVRLIHFSSLT